MIVESFLPIPGIKRTKSALCDSWRSAAICPELGEQRKWQVLHLKCRTYGIQLLIHNCARRQVFNFLWRTSFGSNVRRAGALCCGYVPPPGAVVRHGDIGGPPAAPNPAARDGGDLEDAGEGPILARCRAPLAKTWDGCARTTMTGLGGVAVSARAIGDDASLRRFCSAASARDWSAAKPLRSMLVDQCGMPIGRKGSRVRRGCHQKSGRPGGQRIYGCARR